jgi:hypothetical protein
MFIAHTRSDGAESLLQEQTASAAINTGQCTSHFFKICLTSMDNQRMTDYRTDSAVKSNNIGAPGPGSRRPVSA